MGEIIYLICERKYELAHVSKQIKLINFQLTNCMLIGTIKLLIKLGNLIGIRSESGEG